jgi:biopolymer transport protein ExbB
MSNLFSVNSPIVFATLLLLIFLSVATWSIALFKLWKQWQARATSRAWRKPGLPN